MNLGSIGGFKPYLGMSSSSSVNLTLDELSAVPVYLKSNTEFFVKFLSFYSCVLIVSFTIF